MRVLMLDKFSWLFPFLDTARGGCLPCWDGCLAIAQQEEWCRWWGKRATYP